MPKFIVRTSIDYDLLIEAETADEAIEKASHVGFEEWGSASTPYEAEEEVEP